MADKDLRVRVRFTEEGNIRGTTLRFTELTSAISLARQGVQTLGQIYNATIGRTIDYARSVQEVASVTGQSTEATSRLLETLDDFGIQASEVQMAMRAMRDQGLSPTIETLGQLSDQYLALNPGAERMNFLVERFGRAGVQWARVLERGRTELQRMNDTVQSALVLTPEQIDQTEDLSLALAELDDRWTAVETNIGTRVIPALNSYLEGSQRVYEEQERARTEGLYPLAGAWQRLEPAIQGVDDALQAVGGDIAQVGRGAQSTATQVGSLSTAIVDLTEAGIAQIAIKDLGEALEGGRITSQQYWTEVARVREQYLGIPASETIMSRAVDDASAAFDAGSISAGAYLNILQSINEAYQVATTGVQQGIRVGRVAPGGRKARGGLLAPISLVGEEGQELVINGVVIPHAETERLLSLGLRHDLGFQRGGILAKPKWPYKGQNIPMKAGLTNVYGVNVPMTAGITNLLGVNIPMSEGLINVDTGANVLMETVAATAAETAGQSAAAFIQTIPMAVAAETEMGRTEQMRSNLSMIAELRGLRADVRALKKTFVTAVHDSIERALA